MFFAPLAPVLAAASAAAQHPIAFWFLLIIMVIALLAGPVNAALKSGKGATSNAVFVGAFNLAALWALLVLGGVL